MIPIVIDPNFANIALIGRDDATVRRLALFDEGGTARLTVYSDEPSLDLEEAAGDRPHQVPAIASRTQSFRRGLDRRFTPRFG